MEKKRFDYKWVVVGACFIMVMISLGFTSSTKSLFPDEIAKALGVPVTLVTIGESCRYISTAIINVFFGSLIAKFGPKKLIFAGFISLVSSMLIYSFAEHVAFLYVAGSLLGIGLAWTTTTMVGYVVGIWCSENKGTIMGIILASNGLGGAAAIQIVGGLIDPDVIGSYRAAYRLIAVVVAVAAVIVLLLFRDKPKEKTVTPVKESKKKRGQNWVGIDFSVAVKRPYFWCALVCIFLSGMILQGTHGIAAMHMKAVGVDYAAVKGLLSFGSILLATAKFLTGFVYDKTGLRITASFCIVLAIISTFLLASVNGGESGFGIAIAYVITGQYALPLETIMLPIYATDLFGEKSYGKVLGLFVSVNTAGYAVGAPVISLCKDLVGSYAPAIYAVGFVMIGVLILLQYVVCAAHKERDRVVAELEAAEAAPAMAE